MAANKHEKDMNVTSHLSELRNTRINTAILFVLLFIAGFIFVKDIYGLFVNDLDFVLNVTSPGDIFWIYFTMAGLIAIIGTLPVLCLQVWLFIKPGLTPTERKASLPYIPAIFLLFIGGLTFGYFIFIKLILPFLLSLNDGMFNEIFTVDKYFKFLLNYNLHFVFIFYILIDT